MKYILLFLLTLLLVFPQKVSAQESGKLTVSPSIMQIDLAEDKPTYTITYTNNTQADLLITLHPQDFTELEDGWKVNFLNEKDAQNYHYSLSSWVDFDKQSFVLKPGEKQDVMVTVEASKLPSGGHYASIIAELESRSEEGKVSIKGALSSLLFVRAYTGNEIEEAEIDSFGKNASFTDFPLGFYLRFKNSGNTSLTPYGLLIVKDVFGHEVARGILNENSLITLPETVRRYDIALSSHNSFLWPSLYHAEVSVTYGKNEKKLSTSESFYSTGTLTVWVYLLGIMLAGWALWIGKRKFNREK